MRRIMALLLVGLVVLASGCIGDGVGLTKEKILNAIDNIETARYDQNFSMTMHFTEPITNRTVNITMSGRVIGMFNKTSGLETGNMTMNMHTMGMNITFTWPYFVNGTLVYLKVDGKWYNVPNNNDISTQAKGSLNVDYIENLLKMKNVTIKTLADGYAFRVNVTFWEFVNATNQTGYLNEAWGNLPGNVTVDTKSGWVEVHLRDDGTPVFIETYMDVVMTMTGISEKPVEVHMTVHDEVKLSEVNKPVHIVAPNGIENASDFDEMFW
ncbi:hypothetical protein [Thermococcus thioreducens]|uniref:Lipoprotein n=1 Tax=Thermococcus thioreducens TaxID=277988 RepID=A0A0Q2XNB4_9EURY|nr:hypothetical protein [Thermococcus thioreducens]ASJ12005.1 hypothetical protein A3L14_03495 [Thermococcus thioreducens]KQH82772.1 hypothetical protein AMR53_04070 [Thermococcus thioreducens]SEW10158.1 hypothetical protein SAMN05216170_1576 [Thermococcus thioreducens]